MARPPPEPVVQIVETFRFQDLLAFAAVFQMSRFLMAPAASKMIRDIMIEGMPNVDVCADPKGLPSKRSQRLGSIKSFRRELFPRGPPATISTLCARIPARNLVIHPIEMSSGKERAGRAY
jgi:hypothetical protein